MSETVTEILRAVIGAFVGTVGFAMLVHVPKKSWLPCGIIASLSYLLYWVLIQAGLSDAVSIFIGSMFGSLSGQICARKLKTIGTVFFMSAIVPVVPGLGLYRMMASLGRGRTAECADFGTQAMITIAMIALGLSMGSFIDKLITRRKMD